MSSVAEENSIDREFLRCVCLHLPIHTHIRAHAGSIHDERLLVSYSIVYVAMNRSSRAFQVPNKVITKEDITPLSRSHAKKSDPREGQTATKVSQCGRDHAHHYHHCSFDRYCRFTI